MYVFVVVVAVVVVVEVRQEERVRPAVVGPGTANVGADVEPGPAKHGRRRWRPRV